MAWATAAECAAVTGVTPDTATLTLAHSTIRAHINRTEDEVVAAATDRDLDWLREAVAWQAAWLPYQPGYLARMGAQSIAQDGLTVQPVSPADLLLAPLAQRALKNLSWLGSRSLRTRPRAPLGEDGAPVSDASWLSEGADPEDGWEDIR